MQTCTRSQTQSVSKLWFRLSKQKFNSFKRSNYVLRRYNAMLNRLNLAEILESFHGEELNCLNVRIEK